MVDMAEISDITMIYQNDTAEIMSMANVGLYLYDKHSVCFVA